MLDDLELDYFVISERKLDDGFPAAQFAVENYELRVRRDRWTRGRSDQIYKEKYNLKKSKEV